MTNVSLACSLAVSCEAPSSNGETRWASLADGGNVGQAAVAYIDQGTMPSSSNPCSKTRVQSTLAPQKIWLNCRSIGLFPGCSE